MTKIIELKLSLTEENLKIIRHALGMAIMVIDGYVTFESKNYNNEFLERRDKYRKAIVNELTDLNEVLGIKLENTLLDQEDCRVLNSNFFLPYLKSHGSIICRNFLSTCFRDDSFNDTLTTYTQIPENEWNPEKKEDEDKND